MDIGKRLYAHSCNERGEAHELRTHLSAVAELARGFGSKFNAGELAYWAGFWHDLGKCHPEFQAYLANPQARRGPDHKSAGAVLAKRVLEPMALPILGHHGGLLSRGEVKAWLQSKAEEPTVLEALAIAQDYLGQLKPERLGWPDGVSCWLQAEFYLRMIFSALTDADFLDTEGHFRPARSDVRSSGPALEALCPFFESNQEQLSGKQDDSVSAARHEVYQACLRAAEEPQGFFRLTVPTGGGKTRSALAFGLRHAVKHKLDRIIFAIPYTSIIEQTTEVYRSIFGDHVVLEHHSAVNDEEDPENPAPEQMWRRLSSENWDAPIVVTTTVQLFESLFSNKPSRCRKLHNVGRSVVILDEAQMLPPSLLDPILDGLKQLVNRYGVTVVLSTATQPALEDGAYLKGISAVRDIVADYPRLFSTLQRVKYHLPEPGERLTWAEVGNRIRRYGRVLGVVNTKRDALCLLDELNDSEAFHLSTRLCGAHRHDVLEEIKRRLKEGAPCRVISTQVVEAGVDFDFPVVFRAVGPLDRIVQAAGRCNREGLLAEGGHAFIFDPAEGGLPAGAYRTGTGITSALLGKPGFDFHDPGVYQTYFRRLFESVETDAKNIQEWREGLDYPEVACPFRMIEDDTVPVVVRYYGLDGKNRKIDALIEGARDAAQSPRTTLRKLQPFLVNIRRRDLERCQRDGLVQPFLLGLWEWLGKYDLKRGLVEEGFEPGDLVV